MTEPWGGDRYPDEGGPLTVARAGPASFEPQDQRPHFSCRPTRIRPH